MVGNARCGPDERQCCFDTQEDLVLGKKLASGGFGTVYKAELLEHSLPDSEARDVILKKVGLQHPLQLHLVCGRVKGSRSHRALGVFS